MREHLVFLGTSFRRIGFTKLAGYVLPLEDGDVLRELRAALGAKELVYIATCNRVEAYLCFPGPRPPDAAELRARGARFFAARLPGADAGDFVAKDGEAALEHLFSVCASLQSLVLGECEIAGQVRRAAESAAARGLSGEFLERVFTRAARVARRVRSETAIGRTPVSVASLVLRFMREHFREAPPARAVLVGVGDVTKKVAGAIDARETKLVFVNRTESRAQELAARFGGEAMSLERFRRGSPRELDLLVSATRAPGTVIDEEVLRPALDGRSRRLLLCDLGLPPDIDPALGAHPGARLLTLADLEATAQENRARLEGEVEKVKAIVASEVGRFASELHVLGLAEESVEGVLASRLSHLDAADRETVRRFATQLAARIARQP